MAGKVTCPDCAGLGVVFVLDVHARKVQVTCGHSVCMQAREDHNVYSELIDVATVCLRRCEEILEENKKRGYTYPVQEQ